MMGQTQGDDTVGDFDMLLIGNFLNFASWGHAPIVELLLHYNANVNLIDQWQRTPLTDARLYGHRDICRILEVNGGKDVVDDNDFSNDQPMGVLGESQKVQWCGTWVVKTVIKRQMHHPVKMDVQLIMSARDNTLLQELRHPNICSFSGNLEDILNDKTRLDLPTALRNVLDIARGMNYLHEHKPNPIAHNHLDLRNLLQDEGDHLKIGEYWIELLYKQIHPNQDCGQMNENFSIMSNPFNDTKKDIYSLGIIFYQMLQGMHQMSSTNSHFPHVEPIDLELKFEISRCPKRIQQLIEQCTSKDPSERPSFTAVIEILEEASDRLGRTCICTV
ncbi:hypothetical protein SLEP1_g10769 [Rubroshorea leprosula]|uniref:Protein kinase domain-containing protein n=1 Tax=Rubroshorea leprosula TaxID=152421 RepID=A0AAV5IH20_9ROSI|nr:hypothetical protein SLEP1_g10769 [Rubroshorea leprosula]